MIENHSAENGPSWDIKRCAWRITSSPCTGKNFGTKRFFRKGTWNSDEYLAQILFRNKRNLEDRLDEFQIDYTTYRAHQSLNLKTPVQAAGKGPSPRAKFGKFA